MEYVCLSGVHARAALGRATVRAKSIRLAQSLQPNRMARLPVVSRRFGASCAAALLLGVLCGGPSLSAQDVARGDRITVRSGTALRSTPGGEVIGVSTRPIVGAAELVQSSFVRITIEGFVASGDVRVAANRSRGEVQRVAGTTVRATAGAGAAAVAELRRTATVFPARAGGSFPAGPPPAFLAMRRSLWVDVSRVTGARRVAATPARAPTAPTAAPVAAPVAAARESVAPAPVPVAPEPMLGPTLETLGAASLRTGPGGDVLATLPGGSAVTSLARENGWVRVRVEGWLPDSSVGAAGARATGSLTAAELRANPVGTIGRLVRWSVEALSFQTADSLRRGLAPGERYLLARGPGAERAVLYLAVPDSLAAEAQALAPLAPIMITARVRSGRSLPAGVPVLDLLEFTRR